MNQHVKDALKRIFQAVDQDAVDQSEWVETLRVGYEVATNQLAELREKRDEIKNYLDSFGARNIDPDAEIHDYVYEGDDDEIMPRVWSSLSDICEHVRVIDNQGDHWKIASSGYWAFDTNGDGRYTTRNPELCMSHWDKYGPFVEVV